MKFFAIGLACALMSTIESLKVQQHLPEHMPNHNDDVWENTDNDCSDTDQHCWQDWFAAQLDCDDDDHDCWDTANDHFTCGLDDPHCWDENVDDFPCDPEDDACLSDLLPDNVPCDFGEDCWGN